MTDILDKLREPTKHPGQWRLEAIEEIERLRQRGCVNIEGAPHGFLRDASHSENRYVCECEQWAEQEIERLRAALTYEENRFGRIGTHGPDCYKWGPSHYECALREIAWLRVELSVEEKRCGELWELLAASQAREAKFHQIEEAAKNLIAVKGRHHAEQAYKRLEEALK